MSVFDGEIEYKSTVMVDYTKHNKPIWRPGWDRCLTLLHRGYAPIQGQLVKKKVCTVQCAIICCFELPTNIASYLRVMKLRSKNVRRKPTDDSCLIVGLRRDSLKALDEQCTPPDVLCPARLEHYKAAVDRFAEKHPDLVERYMRKEIDPTPVQHELQDTKRTEYLVEYCSRDLPFMSINLARRARALQTLRLRDDTPVPLSTQRAAFRTPDNQYYERQHSTQPKYDVNCQDELRRLLRVNTGLSSYEVSHGLLGRVVLEKQPFGPSREEPKFGKWRTTTGYTYWI
ncbi:hypothetical protein EVAR_83749_1 [Eumeta japonica]|uniref:Uncharacterized protein n=1 Tax=Eumeta variegata TaxID=151549 RepID=A0A4C1W9H2_EUMVA|nr:hypothetical protein EVAR_83749_1 [Eumeta japonica]